MATVLKTMKPGSKLRASDAVLFRELDGEAVLLNLGTNTYFGLNEAGTRMWNLLVEHGELEPVRERLRAEYDVNDEQLGADLESLVEDLLDHRLLIVDDVA